MKQGIFWFRRDLRTEDNVGLFHALQECDHVIPVFVFDTTILDRIEDKKDHRVTFIHETLQELHSEFEKYGSSLIVRSGDPQEIIVQLAKEYDVSGVYTNRDYEPYARVRDESMTTALHEIDCEFKTYKDHVVFEPGEILKDNGEPYMVYTPFKNKWLAHFKEEMTREFPSSKNLTKLASLSAGPVMSLEEIGFEQSSIPPDTYNISNEVFHEYKINRDYPNREWGVSRISPYLRFGQVSTREAYRKAMSAGSDHFVSELIWREFFQHVLWYFPNSKRKAIKPLYDTVEWSRNKKHFKQWCEGKTGYPIVDAGMRELNETGYMHNRVRMITASFLCKHLQIDWRWGEEYFAKKLFDYEMASNVGNWQWVAGSGTDTMPYFRIFNPYTQQEKFDPEEEYIARWISEYKTDEYPDPIVDHKEAREKTLEMYKKAVKKKED